MFIFYLLAIYMVKDGINDELFTFKMKSDSNQIGQLPEGMSS